MPELPEVETIRRSLEPALVGHRIAHVETRRPDLRFPFPPRFTARLTGRRVIALERRGKHLLARLDDDMVWVTHLGMTGRWSIVGAARQPGSRYYADAPAAAHTHVVLRMDDGGRLEFNDPRRFGYMNLIAARDLAEHPFFRRMGPEPLGPEFHLEYLKNALAGRKARIKDVLLDQRIVAGLGNIYVVEALHRAGISPERSAGGVASTRLARLFEAIRQVLREAIEAGGSTLSDYANVDGAQGSFQDRFRVYDREGERCLKRGCGGTIVRAAHGSRSSFWCSRCQR